MYCSVFVAARFVDTSSALVAAAESVAELAAFVAVSASTPAELAELADFVTSVAALLDLGPCLAAELVEPAVAAVP